MADTRGARTVLVADDDAGHLRLMELVLSAHDFTVVTVENGQDAVQYLESNTPDLMILDVHMPFMTGLDVCSQARGSTRLSRVPIIIMTSHRDDDTDRKALGAGADLLMGKPLTGQDLRGAIHNLLSRPG